MGRIHSRASSIALSVLSPTIASAGQPHFASTVAYPSSAADALVVVQDAPGFTLVTHAPRHREDPPHQLTRIVNLQAREQSTLQELPARVDPASARRQAYLGQVAAAEARYALPSGLLDAIVWTESRYNPFAVSSKGAVGLGQIMPGTAKDLRVHNRWDPISNIDGAARYLRALIDRFGLIDLAIAAYNAGPSTVAHKGTVPLNSETPGYVASVLRRWSLQDTKGASRLRQFQQPVR